MNPILLMDSKKYKLLFRKEFYDGDYLEWYDNGQLKISGVLDMGTKVSNWKYWLPNGGLLKVENYKKGILNGPFEKYDPKHRSIN